MLKDLQVVNDTMDDFDNTDIGGEWGCYMACAGGCLITKMILAAYAVATMDLS